MKVLQLDVSMTEPLTMMSLAGLDKERPMKIGQVWAPRGDRIADGLVIYGENWSKRVADQSLLLEFLKLSDEKSKPAAVLQFCKKWGILGLCAHGIPPRHGSTFCQQKLKSGELLAERYQDIVQFSGVLAALLRIGAALSQDQPGDDLDWSMVDLVLNGNDFPVWTAEYRQIAHAHASTARTSFQIQIRRLLKICGVLPRFYWNEHASSWQIDLDAEGPNVAGLLAIQFILTVADKDGFAICSACRRAYLPARRPDPTRRNYCGACGKRAAWRDSQRELRHKKREESHVKKTRTK